MTYIFKFSDSDFKYTQFYRILEYLVTMVKIPNFFYNENSWKSSELADGNLTYCPHGTEIKITTHWRQQIVTTEREI